MDGWICNVLQRRVMDLALFVNVDDYFFDLPREIFVSKTLVNLKLRSEGGLLWWTEAAGTFSPLPMLKTLVIHLAWIFSDTIEILQPALPVLEELDIAIHEWKDPDVTISNASARKLTISTSGCDIFLNPKSISFDTPSLVYFEYSDFVAEDYPKVNLTNLVEARINLLLTEDQIERARVHNNGWLEDDEDDVFLRFGNVGKLMNGIRNVHKLYLSAITLEVLSLCCESMPVFNNLKLLVIKSDVGRGWQALPVLLRNCPHLETLVIEGLLHYVTDKCGDACACIFQEDKSRSLRSCPVKTLQIQGFGGTKRELDNIKHFLDYFPCLKEMEIYAEENDSTCFEGPGIFELVVELLNLYNALSSCDVHFWVPSSLYRKWIAK